MLAVLVALIALTWVVTRFYHSGDDDSQVSDYRMAQLLHQCEMKEQAEERRKQKAREQPERYAHDFADVSYRVRVMSHAELVRTSEEKKALQFLRGGKG